MLAWQYGQTEATRHQAKYSVTELRRSAEPGEEEAESLMAEAGLAPQLPKLEMNNSTLKAEAYGTAHHKFLQHFALEKSGDLAGEADRLLTAKIISVEEREVLNLRSLAAFWNSELGRAIQMHSPAVRRELPFTARFSPAEINAITGRLPDDGLAGEYLVLQGVADLVVRLPDEIWLVEFIFHASATVRPLKADWSILTIWCWRRSDLSARLFATSDTLLPDLRRLLFQPPAASPDLPWRASLPVRRQADNILPPG